MSKTKAMAIGMRAEEAKWRVEGDLNTLIEAEKIKVDKARFAAARALAKEKMMSVAKVASDDED